MNFSTEIHSDPLLPRHLLSLVENMRDAVVITMPTKPEIIYVNPAFISMTGYGYEEIVGLSPAVLQGERSDRVELGRIRDSISRKEPVRCEVINYRKNGMPFWVELDIFPVKDESGDLQFWMSVQRDISDRKLSEALAQQQGLHAITILESISEAFALLDKDWRYVYVNRQAERIKRKTRQELIGHTVWELFPEYIGSSFESNARKAADNNIPVIMESYFITLQSWFEIHFYPHPDGISVYFTDITERKRQEVIIENKFKDDLIFSQQLRSLQEVSSYLAGIRDQDLLFRTAVELAHSRLGIDRLGLCFFNQEQTEVLGTFGIDESGNLRDERNSHHVFSADSNIAQISTQPNALIIERDTVLRNDQDDPVGRGTLVLAAIHEGAKSIGFLSADNLITSIPISEQQIEILRLYASALGQLTVRLKTEHRLRESEERYRSLFLNIPDPAWVYDTDTHKFLDVNDAAITSYGYTRDEFLSMSIFEIRPAEDIPEFLEKLKHKSDDSHQVVNVRHLHKNGNIVEVEVTASDVLYNNRIARIVQARDITEKKLLESKLLHSQKMESVGRLAGGVAHDFNNLLGAIMGYIELVMEESGLDTIHKGYLDSALQASERAARLVRQLLTFSRRQIVETHVISLNDLIITLTDMLKHMIGEDIKLLLELEDSLWPVRIDPGQMEQALVNLAVNSRDAMPSGGELTIRTENLLREDKVRLTIIDTGTGLSDDVKSHLFEPFFTTKELGKGTGLGLSTCYGIVKQAGGEIVVDSEYQNGAVFMIKLPHSRLEVEPAVDTKIEVSSSSGTETILLVEDEPLLLEIAEISLLKRGYRILSTTSPLEALEIVRNSTEMIDLVVSDVVMPQMNGVELTRQIRQIAPTIRTLFVSGYSEDQIAHNQNLLAGLSYLQKPYNPDLLAHKIRETLDKRLDYS